MPITVTIGTAALVQARDAPALAPRQALGAPRT